MNDASPAQFDMTGTLTPLGISEFKALVERDMRVLYESAIDEATRIDPLCAELLVELRQASLAGGKRLRPYLTYLAYLGHGGHDTDSLVSVAVAQELYHHAWLLHDDVMDGDRYRHGQPNIVGAYHARTKGDEPTRRKVSESIGIIGGDILMSLAARHFFSAKLPPRRISDAFVDLQSTFTALAGGQQLDVIMPLLSPDEVTSERLLKVCQYKTASYSFEAPLRLGAILAGADNVRLAAITAFAIPLGIGYQLRDDMLAMFGNDEEVGKPGISDLREGKLTLIIHETLSLSPSADRTTLLGILGNADAGPNELAKARQIIERCGARDRVEAMIRRYEFDATDTLASLGLAGSAETALAELVRRLQGRQS